MDFAAADLEVSAGAAEGFARSGFGAIGEGGFAAAASGFDGFVYVVGGSFFVFPAAPGTVGMIAAILSFSTSTNP